MAIEAVKCGQMRRGQGKTGFSFNFQCVRENYFMSLIFPIAAAHRPLVLYRNNLSTFDIFYQIHFFPVQKLLIDLLLLSLSIALAAWAKWSCPPCSGKKFNFSDTMNILAWQSEASLPPDPEPSDDISFLHLLTKTVLLMTPSVHTNPSVQF